LGAGDAPHGLLNVSSSTLVTVISTVVLGVTADVDVDVGAVAVAAFCTQLYRICRLLAIPGAGSLNIFKSLNPTFPLHVETLLHTPVTCGVTSASITPSGVPYVPRKTLIAPLPPSTLPHVISNVLASLAISVCE
jgi:hypothetical protein